MAHGGAAPNLIKGAAPQSGAAATTKVVQGTNEDATAPPSSGITDVPSDLPKSSQKGGIQRAKVNPIPFVATQKGTRCPFVLQCLAVSFVLVIM